MGSKTSKGEKPTESKAEGGPVDLTKNKKWVTAMEEYFDVIDINKNGYICIEEVLKWSDNMKELCKVTSDEVKNFQDSLKEFYEAIGLLPEKHVTKQEFVEGVNRLSEVELKRKRSGEETLHEKLGNAMFDVVDTNDDGTVTLDEVKTAMKVFNVMDEAKAEGWFNKADKNENGRVERKELIKIDFDFWFGPKDDCDETDKEEK